MSISISYEKRGGAGSRTVGIELPAECDQAIRWASAEFASSMKARGTCVEVFGAVGSRPNYEAMIEVKENEAFGVDGFEFQPLGHALVLAGGARGVVYGLLELRDRVECGGDPVEVITGCQEERHDPSAELRSVVRYFTNRELDYPWFIDESFWPPYLTELATHRFQRFSLAFGLGQDYGHDHGVTDNYLNFVYPFLLEVPGFDVKASGVSAQERSRNLSALRYVAKETVRRGLEFNLSLWAHNYTFPFSPELTHPVVGLSNESWPHYCGRALSMLLEEVPEISGLTLRIHYEGGVPDDDRHRFWSAVLGEIKNCSRVIEIDIHSKGADEPTVRLFRSAGMPLTVSTKFAGEHLTLPYHAASIRPQERQPAAVGGNMSVTRGARIFTRYSYGDFMQRGRDYKVATRVWNGTQRFLLWADPLFAAAMGREATFDGASGLEVFDPLSLRGRWNTASNGSRTAYSDRSLEPEKDWQKFIPFYRVWGRGVYGDKGLAEAWRRYLLAACGADGEALGKAISSASRILPLIMSAHAPGAGNRDYWPELYMDVPFLDEPGSASGRGRMGTVSPLDPELFYGISEYVDAELGGNLDARYRPTEIADWFDRLAMTVEAQLAGLSAKLEVPAKRIATDAAIQAKLGRFFAAKFRAALHYERYCRTSDPADVHAAAQYAAIGRDHWRDLSELGDTTYIRDIGFGRPERLGGTWSSRMDLVSRNADLLLSQAAKVAGVEDGPKPFAAARSLEAVPEFSFEPVDGYAAGTPLDIGVNVIGASEVTLHYRQVNHADRFRRLPMQRDGERFTARLDGEVTSGKFDLIYFVSAQVGSEQWLLPGFGPELAERPYVLARGTEESLSRVS